MKNALFALLLFCFPSNAFCQTIPFEVELEEVNFPDLPALHSFAFGEWDGKWVFLGGRSNGLHGFFPFSGFPVSSANSNIWVVDSQTGESWSFDVNELPDALAEPLLATNPQYVQQGSYLSIIGGYGKKMTTDDFVTHPTLLVVDLEILVSVIVGGGDPASSFQLLEDDRFRVCGGDMLRLGDYVYLVGGHDFTGLYNSNGAPTFTQTYTSEIRRFKIALEDTSLIIVDYQAFSNPEFHRRDLNVAPILQPNGEPALAVYGGVFQPDKDLPFLHPIYIMEDEIEVDESYFQQMSQYTCPVLPVFDVASGDMYSIFFGGISLHYQDEVSGQLIADSLMPFINDITVFTRKADGTSSELVLSLKFDELLGTNAKFIPSSQAPHFENEVLNLNAMQGRTFAGYIYGGIEAVIPNITPSSASNRLFKVYLTPVVSGVAATAAEVVHGYAFPNPFSGELQIRIPESFHPDRVQIAGVSGEVVWKAVGGIADDLCGEAEVVLERAMPGLYFLEMGSGEKICRIKVVKME